MSIMLRGVKSLVTDEMQLCNEDRLALKIGSSACEGQLLKMGFVNTAWQSRYFCLQKEYIYYFKTQKDARLGDVPKGKINIRHAVISSIQASDLLDVQHGQFTFSVKTAPEADDRTYLLKAPDVETRNQWRQAIENMQGEYKTQNSQLDFTCTEFWRSETTCMGCHKKFTMTRRRHHCRADGHAYCQGCASKRAILSSGNPPQRVCKRCFKLLAQGKSAQFAFNEVNASRNGNNTANNTTNNNNDTIIEDEDPAVDGDQDRDSDNDNDSDGGHIAISESTESVGRRIPAGKPSKNRTSMMQADRGSAIVSSSLPIRNNSSINPQAPINPFAESPSETHITSSSWLEKEELNSAPKVNSGVNTSVNYATNNNNNNNTKPKGPALKTSYIQAAKRPVHRNSDINNNSVNYNNTNSLINNSRGSGVVQTPIGPQDGTSGPAIQSKMAQRPAATVLIHDETPGGGYTHLPDESDSKGCCAKCTIQ